MATAEDNIKIIYHKYFIEIQVGSPVEVLIAYAPNPFEYALPITRIIAPLSFVFVIFMTIALIGVIKRLPSMKMMNIPVAAYSISQVALFGITGFMWLYDLFIAPYQHPTFADKEPRGDYNNTELQMNITRDYQDRCLFLHPPQLFTIINPNYSILLIAITRSIFLKYPLSYFDFIKTRYIIIYFGVVTFLNGLLASLPNMGLCEIRPKFIRLTNFTAYPDPHNVTIIPFCDFDDEEWECRAFYSLVVIIGFIVPVITTTGLYGVMHRVAVKARKQHARLIGTSSNICSSKNEPTGEEQPTQEAGKPKKVTLSVFNQTHNIPWPIIVILIWTNLTTIPWVYSIINPTKILLSLVLGDSWTSYLDLIYSIVLSAVGASPMIYMMLTSSLRNGFIGMFRKRVARVGVR